MTMKYFCEKCDRDITDEDRVEIRLQINVQRILEAHIERGAKASNPSQPRDWDLCLDCARSLLPRFLIEQKP